MTAPTKSDKEQTVKTKQNKTDLSTVPWVIARIILSYVALFILVGALTYPAKVANYKITFEDDARILNREMYLDIYQRNYDLINNLLRNFVNKDHVNRVSFKSKPDFIQDFYFGEHFKEDWSVIRPIYNFADGVFYGELEIGYQPITFMDHLRELNQFYIHLFGLSLLTLLFFTHHYWQKVRFQNILMPIPKSMDDFNQLDYVESAKKIVREFVKSSNEQIDKLSDAIDQTRSLHLSSFENFGMPIAIVNIDGKILGANAAFTNQFAPTGSGIEGRFFYQFISPDARQMFLETLESVDYQHAQKRISTKIMLDGEVDQLPAVVSVNYDTLSKERIIVVENKAEIFALRNRLEAALAYDLNSGLLRKQGLVDNINGLLRILDSNRMRVGVVVFKLTSLARIRDLYGIETADRVMASLAEVVRTRVAPSAVRGLLSDNELVLALHSTRSNVRDETVRAIRPIKQYLNEVIYINKRPINLSHIIGVSVWPEAGEDAEQLLQRASLSSTTWNFDDPISRIEYSNERVYDDDSINIKSVLTNAAVEGRIQFDLQPIYRMSTDQVSMFELLVRLENRDGERIMPNDFLEVAEQMNMMGDIAQYMVNAASDIFARADNENSSFMLTMNLSVSQLLLPDLFDILLPIKPYRGRVIIEVGTSNEVFHPKVVSVLRNLVEDGFTIAADDLDATSCNLVKLSQLPVQIIKLDKIFFNLLDNSENHELVYEYLQNAQKMNKKFVVERIETEEELQIVKDLNIDFAQGFYLGKPLDNKKVDIDDYFDKDKGNDKGDGSDTNGDKSNIVDLDRNGRASG